MAGTKKENKKLKPIIVNDEIDLIAVWERVRMGWVLIVIFALLGMGLGVVVGKMLPEQYEVTAVLTFPKVWNVSPDVSMKIVDNYVEKMEYEGVALKAEFYGIDKNIKLTGKGSSVDEIKRVLYDIKGAIDADGDVVAYRDESVKLLLSNKTNLDAQLADAYQKKDLYDALVKEGESAVILGSNPIEINETIVLLEEKRSEIDLDMNRSDSVQWGVSPSSSEKNVQISWKLLAIAGLFMGGALGFFVAVVRKQ